jgi:membrane-associated phospholipid phosphatase
VTAVGGTLPALAPRRAETDGHRFFEVHRHALGVGVVCLVAGLVLAVIVERDPVRPVFQGVDDWWIAWAKDHRSGGLVRTAEAISVLGGVTVLLPLRLVAAIVLAARQWWLQLAVFTAAVVSSEVLIGVLKSWTDRPRPPGSLVETTGASFPSGHAIAGAVTALALVVAFVPARVERLRYIGLAAAFAAVVSMSRMYLAAHWFSDVVAGTLLGVGIALIWPATLELVRERRIGPGRLSTVPVTTSAAAVEGRLKRRRPSGERPPLPRPVPVQARRALVVAGGVIVVWASLELRFGERSWMRRVDRSLLAVVPDHRASWMVTAARAIDTLTHVAVVHAAVLLVVVALLCVRQVRRAVVFGAAFLGTEVVVAAVSNGMRRPRPYNVDIVGSWAGYASPSAPVAALTSLLLAVGFAFVPAGVARRWARWSRWWRSSRQRVSCSLSTTCPTSSPAPPSPPWSSSAASCGWCPMHRSPSATAASGPTSSSTTPGRQRSSRPCANNSVCRSSRSNRSARPGRRARPLCCCARRARCCSPSCSPNVTSAPTASTSSSAPCCTDGWRTSVRSPRCADWR